MSKKILLVEPDFKNKYPPLGLMKISTYHKEKGHEVIFFKGLSKELRAQAWDRIYISTLFTFYWKRTIDTIKYYSKSVKMLSDIYVGGVMASLLKNDIESEIPVTVIGGLLNKKGKLGYSDDYLVDSSVPDYSIIDSQRNALLNYYYPTSDCYIAYATRGCIRKCKFCAVHKIEPNFSNGLSIAKQVNAIKRSFGEKKDLLLLDNNILASDKFEEIIEEIKSIGFEKGKNIYQNRKKRYVDFNQGIDARLLTREKMKMLSEIAVRPLRIAFDNISDKEIYIEKVRWAAEAGIKILSNYVLFNFNDKPEDFYERLKINVDLNEEFQKKGLKSQIWSFPMKYSPITGEYCKNRKYVGQHWNKKYLRAIQCVLIATHGVVGPKKDFFERAFGRNIDEYHKILMMPEEYIIYREKYEKNKKVFKWERALNNFLKNSGIIDQHILKNDFREINDMDLSTTNKELVKYYL
jgi:hypothetical protein